MSENLSILLHWIATVAAVNAIYWEATVPGDQILVTIPAGLVLGFIGARAGMRRPGLCRAMEARHVD